MYTRPLPQTTNQRGLRRFRQAFAAIVVGVLAAAIVAIPGIANASTPTLSTDQSVYYPGQTVHFSGSGLDASTTYALPVQQPDGSIVTGDGSGTSGWDQVTTDPSGNLSYDYLLIGMDGVFEGRVYPADWAGDWSAAPLASATFSDPASADIDQCRNGTFAAPVHCDSTTPPPGEGWVNGNSNSTQAHWREGDSIPYRVKFAGLTAGTSGHFLSISYGTTKSGKHALDYLTTYNRTETTADPCFGISGCGSPTTFPIPTDPNVTGAGVPQVPGVFTCFNCTITSVSSYTVTGTYATTSDTHITINFTAGSGTGGTHPVIAWSAHIASQFDWGAGNGAGSISGSPYHTSLDDSDAHGGAQDRQLQSAAIVGPPGIATQASKSTISPGDSVTDTATITHFGSQGPVNGTVTFFVCGPDTTGPPNCFTGGTQVGSPVTVTITNSPAAGDGSATSSAFTPGNSSSTNGYYCFRAEYTPAATAQYSLGKETNTTTECFQQVAVGVSIVKVSTNADPSDVDMGDDIGYSITVTSTGPGTAHNVVVTDPLPVKAGISWSVDPSSDAGCSITANTLTCNWGDMAPSTSKTVTITSPTTLDSCGYYFNQATVTTDNAGSATSDNVEITVVCSNVHVHKAVLPRNINATDQVKFTFDISNSGPYTAEGVTMTDTLDSSVTGWAVDDTTDCSISGNLLSCSFASDLGVNQHFPLITLTGTTTTASCPAVPNLAKVAAANESNKNAKDNTSGQTAAVSCPNVHVTQKATTATVAQPGKVGFKITFTNGGPGKAYNATVTESLPTNAGLNWSTATPGCSISAGTLTCSFGTLASGAIKYVTITSSTTAATCGTVSSTASVSASNETAAAAADNSASASATVTC